MVSLLFLLMTNLIRFINLVCFFNYILKILKNIECLSFFKIFLSNMELFKKLLICFYESQKNHRSN